MTVGEKLAYVAGIIDGEGSISITGKRTISEKGTPYWVFDVEVGAYNTAPPLLVWLKQHFGGEYAPRKPQTGQRKPCYRWRLIDNGTRQQFLTAVLPYLVIKGEQARIVLKYLSLPRINPKRRLELYRKIRTLNARSPRKPRK